MQRIRADRTRIEDSPVSEGDDGAYAPSSARLEKLRFSLNPQKLTVRILFPDLSAAIQLTLSFLFPV